MPRVGEIKASVLLATVMALLVLGLFGTIIGLRAICTERGRQAREAWHLDAATRYFRIGHRLGQPEASEALVETLLVRGELLEADRVLASSEPREGLPRARWLRRKGVVLFGFDQADAALDALAEARRLLRSGSDQRAAGKPSEHTFERQALMSRIAIAEARVLYFSKGRLDTAESLVAGALRTARRIGDGVLEAHALRNLGVIFWLRDLEQGPEHDFYRPALELYRHHGHLWGEAVTLSNLGLIALEQGDVRAFLRHQLRSLELKERIGDRLGQSESYTYLSNLYRQLGNHRRAFELGERGLALAEQIGYRLGADILEYRLAHLAISAGQVEQGEARLEAVTRRSSEPWIASRRWWLLTSIRLHLGRLEAARASLRMALEAEGAADHDSTEGLWLGPLTQAKIALAEGNFDAAAELLAEARQLAPGRRVLWQEKALLEVEVALAEPHDKKLALALLLRLVELEGRELGPSPSSLLLGDSTGSSGHRDRLLEILIESAVNLPGDFAINTLHRVLEGQRHRALRNLVVSTRGPQSQRSVVPSPLPAEPAQDLFSAVSAANESRYRNYAAWEDRILESRLRVAERSMIGLLRPRSLAATRAALPERSALIEFVVTTKGSAALVSNGERTQWLPLPFDRATIRLQIDLLRSLLTREEPAHAWHPVAESLADSILVPIDRSGMLEGIERLLLLPHGPLHDLPFAAIRLESAGKRAPLIDRFSLLRLPAAVVLGIEQAAERPRSASGEITRWSFGYGEDPATPRVGAAQEARRVAQLTGAQPVVGQAASETHFRRILASATRVHVAAHGLSIAGLPLLSSLRLAASDEHDGWLTIPEILDLRTDAELIVLGACQTGQSHHLAGEVSSESDRIALADAFLYAGAQNVLASLILVDDRSTRALMERYYQLLAELGPVAALAQAQRELAADPRIHPSAWAGFALIGTGTVAAENP